MNDSLKGNFVLLRGFPASPTWLCWLSRLLYDDQAGQVSSIVLPLHFCHKIRSSLFSTVSRKNHGQSATITNNYEDCNRQFQKLSKYKPHNFKLKRENKSSSDIEGIKKQCQITKLLIATNDSTNKIWQKTTRRTCYFRQTCWFPKDKRESKSSFSNDLLIHDGQIRKNRFEKKVFHFWQPVLIWFHQILQTIQINSEIELKSKCWHFLA